MLLLGVLELELVLLLLFGADDVSVLFGGVPGNLDRSVGADNDRVILACDADTEFPGCEVNKVRQIQPLHLLTILVDLKRTIINGSPEGHETCEPYELTVACGTNLSNLHFPNYP